MQRQSAARFPHADPHRQRVHSADGGVLVHQRLCGQHCVDLGAQIGAESRARDGLIDDGRLPGHRTGVRLDAQHDYGADHLEPPNLTETKVDTIYFNFILTVDEAFLLL